MDKIKLVVVTGVNYALPMMQSNQITTNPEQCGGRPCIRGMRIRVTDVLELLANGTTPEQIITDELPDLTLADIQACLQYAVAKINHPVLQVTA